MKKIAFLVASCFLMGSITMAQSSLKTYRKRRALKKTSKIEPYGRIKKSTSKGKEPMFVIQKHDATHLHYDFRLEIDGVLKSWAVPKGLPAKQGIRRLAMPTDDHPMEYGDFEGIIPQGHYGGGTVMVWDIGTFANIKEEKGKLIPLSECYKRGTIEVFLKGKKIWGPYALIKTSGLYSKDSWILLRMKKDAALFKKPKNRKAIKKDVSALSERTMKQIEKDHDAEWQ